MTATHNMHARRVFLARLGGAGAALALGACAKSSAQATTTPSPSSGAWDLSWIPKVERARHRAVFDAANGDLFLMLAARFLDNVRDAHGAVAPDVVAVLNVRTRATAHALGDAIWAKYPVGEDAAVKDPATNAPARRNVNYAVQPSMDAISASFTYERLQPRGIIVLVCDFALGHLATRLATKVGANRDAVYAELRNGLVPGAVLVPSGIYGMAQAQNAGCAYVPS